VISKELFRKKFAKKLRKKFAKKLRKKFAKKLRKLVWFILVLVKYNIIQYNTLNVIFDKNVDFSENVFEKSSLKKIISENV
jgi:hypothetical protein